MSEGIRCHFAIIFSRTYKFIAALAALVLFNGYNSFTNTSDDSPLFQNPVLVYALIVGGFLLATGLILLYQFLVWRKTFVSFSEDSFVVERKTMIFQRKTTVKLTQISTVNLQKTIIDRIFGTYTLQLDINSAATANKTDFVLVFSEPVAKQFQSMLTNQMEFGSNTDPSQENEANTPPTLVHSFSTMQLIRHCILDVTATALTTVFAITSVGFTLLTDVTNLLTSFIIIPIVLVIIVFSFGTALIKNLLQYYGFEIAMQHGRMYITYGFFVKQSYILPIGKSNAVVIKQSPFGRLFGLYYAEIINVGMGDEEQKKAPVFCLMLKKDELVNVMKQVTPEFTMPNTLEHSPTKALLSIYARYALVMVIPFIVTVIFIGWWAPIVLFLLSAPPVYLSYRTKALHLGEHQLTISNGIFAKKTVLIPYSKIQKVHFNQGPITHKLGICSGEIHILSSILTSNHPIGLFPKDRFKKIAENTVQFDSYL